MGEVFHAIKLDLIESLMLQDIQHQIDFVMNEPNVRAKLIAYKQDSHSAQDSTDKKRLHDVAKCINELDGLIQSVYDEMPGDMFRRHDNCDCTIIYDGQVLRGKQNADGSRSKTWEELPNTNSDYTPAVLSEADARAVEQRNLQRFRGLTNGENSGKIKTVGVNNVTGENATIDKRKFTEYALNPEKQPDKAKAFESALGYNLNNYDLLEEKIREDFDRKKLIGKGQNAQGDKYELHYEITGVNGKTAKVLTSWLDDVNDKKDFHLTSLYVDK